MSFREMIFVDKFEKTLKKLHDPYLMTTVKLLCNSVCRTSKVGEGMVNMLR